MLTVSDKMRELILYISEKSADDPPFGATKLNKILFYSDFCAYQRRRSAITGDAYFKLPQGPAPRRMKPLLRTMIADGDLSIKKTEYFGKKQKRPIACRAPKLDAFSQEELAIVDDYIERFWGKSAKEVSDLSHGFIGWELADLKEEIPYYMAFSVPVGEPTEQERRYAAQLRPIVEAIRNRAQ